MKPSGRFRIGAVSYLNTKPLVFGMESLAPELEVVYDLPSRLADRLAAGELEVALIPSIEVFQDPTYTIVSDACIGCRGPVLSVKLLSRVPAEQIKTLALDEGSRTSVALVRILLQQKFGVCPELVPFPIGSRIEQMETDAVLVIGDRAIHAPSQPFSVQWDLGDQWCRWSELPFVFAMWTARAGIELGDIDEILRQSRDAGVTNLVSIAEAEANKVGIDVAACLAYLRDNLNFFLGPRERQGLELFYRHAAELNLAPKDLDLRFDDCQTS